MPYAVIEPSGCGIHKNRGKLRLDFFLNPDDPHYDKCHVYVVDSTSEEYQKGYQGKVDEQGNPLDSEDYQKWLDSLPHIWRDNPFHSHFIYPDKGTTDTELKAKIESCLSYFYHFHQHCWNNNKRFVDEWKKVPSRAGQVRCPFVKGDSKDLQANQDKVQGILSRSKEFQIGVSKVPPQDLNIGEKGTIDVGHTTTVGAGFSTATFVNQQNPANATGTIDTVKIYCERDMSDVEVASFFVVSGDNLSTRDTYSIGVVTFGAERTFTGLAIDFETNDYIGGYWSDGDWTGESTGFTGIWLAQTKHLRLTLTTVCTSMAQGQRQAGQAKYRAFPILRKLWVSP